MVRLIKDRKLKYISVGVGCFKDLWDSKKNLPLKKHPLSKELIIKIEKTKTDAKRLLMKFEDEKADFSSEEFKESFKFKRRFEFGKMFNFVKVNFEF